VDAVWRRQGMRTKKRLFLVAVRFAWYGI